ncbi:MAG: pyroglutamyl-peptidase I [Alphaproteobacteria bacterium]|nr:MAG: pyroglutamyl-peptidase I [Alphaproteobacteria bacterium]
MGNSPLLITGFDPFDGWQDNPSRAVAQALDGTVIHGVPVVGRVLPVSFTRTAAALAETVAALRPQAVLLCGLAAGETGIRLEQAALNRLHSERGDNDGATIVNQPIDPAGPPARFSRWDGMALRDALVDCGLPATVSFHAGTHCCNLVLYHSLELVAGPVGFIHLPCLPAMAAGDRSRPASLPLATQVSAVHLIADQVLTKASQGVTA